jgi:plastocyanin
MSTRYGFALTLTVIAATACGGSQTTTTTSQQSSPAAAAPAAAAPAGGGAAGKGSGSIAGKVSFEGTPDAPQKVKLSADAKCAAMHKDGLERQTIKVKDGGLADALVYVKSGLTGSYPAPSEPVVLDQQGCDYHPHMVAMQAGQALKIRNSDDTLHNIHPKPKSNEEFNLGQPRKGMESEKKFDKAETMIPVGCDVHPWMRAYISVLSNPFFAVTKDDGSYEIKGLPDGEYEVEVLHGKAKATTQKVSVKGGAAKADFTVKG